MYVQYNILNIIELNIDENVRWNVFLLRVETHFFFLKATSVVFPLIMLK